MAVPETTVTHENAHEDNLMPLVQATDVRLGGDLDLTTGGAYLQTSSRIDGKDSLSPRLPFDDTNAATECKLPFAGQLNTQVPVQPDDGFDFVGTSKTVYIPATFRDKGALIKRYYAKAGSVAATSVVNLKVYRGESAGDIVPENLFYEADLPASLWSGGNGSVFSFAIDEYAVEPYTGKTTIDVLADEGTILVFNSSNQFSAKFNVAQTIPWLQTDEHEINERVALDQFTTRSPFIELNHATGTFPLVLGDNIITSWIVGENQFFNYDGGTGYYEYTGEDQPFMKAFTELSAVSNTSNCFVQHAIDVDDGSTVTRITGTAREFDGSNDGYVSWLSKARLRKGDKVRHVLIASKAAANFDIIYFAKLVEKVS